MQVKTKIAFALNFTIVLVACLVGILYIATSEMTSYHKQVIGVDWNSLAPGVQTLLLILKKGTGNTFLITGIAIAVLLFIPFRQRENWSRWGILVIGLTSGVPMLIGAFYIAKTTGAPSPWWLIAVMLLFLITAFFLTRDFKK